MPASACGSVTRGFNLPSVDPAKANAKVKALLGSGNDALANLARTFNNRTSQGMFRNHKDMPRNR